MTGPEFIAAVRSHPTLCFGEGLRDDRIYLVYQPGDGVKVGWEIEPDTIRENDWDSLEAVFTGARRATVMDHYCRIVGYYSNMRNWNASKQAEARDRRKGVYGVPEAA